MTSVQSNVGVGPVEVPLVGCSGVGAGGWRDGVAGGLFWGADVWGRGDCGGYDFFGGFY